MCSKIFHYFFIFLLLGTGYLWANKFLPFGFGPDKRTIIEDAASFDEDEEEYGDYQVSETRVGQYIIN